jgi:hypothetical protein
MLGGGLFFFATAVLCSSLFEGEYTAPLVAFGAAAAVAFALNDPPLRNYSPWYMLFASTLVKRRGEPATDPIPWLVLAGIAVVSVGLLIMSVKAVERREF